MEQRDSIEIFALEKDHLERQLIDSLYVAGIFKPENDVQRIILIIFLRALNSIQIK